MISVQDVIAVGLLGFASGLLVASAIFAVLP